MSRNPTAFAKADLVRKLLDDGADATSIATQLHIGLASVYRIKNAKAEHASRMKERVAKWNGRNGKAAS